MQTNEIQRQLEIIKRGATQIISEDELKKKLEEAVAKKRPLRVKAGFDPTAPDLHLGHTVLLRKMRQFQELGHKVFFLIGDFTGCIGDPAGRSEIRKQLSEDQVLKNAATYKKQVTKVLDLDKIKIVFNSEWFKRMSVLDMLRLTRHATVSQMLARADFKKRLSRNEDVSLLEFIYPLLQGYDSVVLETDVELGGEDQIFNLLVGRQMQKDCLQQPQVVITLPLLEGTDGVQKMSKTYANFIGINEPVQEMFGKIMSISDTTMWKYYELLTDIDLEVVKKIHPKQAKLQLAENIVSQYHGSQAAAKAGKEFQHVFSAKGLPEQIPVYKIEKEKNNLVSVLLACGMVKSKNEARRLIQQGGVCLDGRRIDKEDTLINQGGILKVGKRNFLRLVA